MKCPRCRNEGFASPQSCPHCGFTQPSLPSFMRTSRSKRKVGAPGMPLQGNRYLLVEQQERHQWSSEVYEVWWFAQDVESREDMHICEVELPQSGSTMLAFLRSATKALLVRSNSPRMPQLLNVFMEQGHCFFVFTHPAGESLHVRIQREGMVLEKEALDCYLQGAATLLFLSEQAPPMVHGSIQPDHLVKVRSNWVFTNTSILIAGGGTDFISPSTLPEGARGIPTPASDLYALTATIYYAVTGVAPSLDPRIQQAQLEPPLLSSAFSAALLQGLHPDVQVRFHHPSEIVRALGAHSSHRPEGAHQASRSRALKSAPSEQKPERSTVLVPQESHLIAQPPSRSRRQQGQEGILLPGGNLPPFPHSFDALMAVVWTLGILLCALLFLHVAR